MYIKNKQDKQENTGREKYLLNQNVYIYVVHHLWWGWVFDGYEIMLFIVLGYQFATR